MKRKVNVKFLMDDVFQKYLKNDDFTVPNAVRIHSSGEDWMIVKDDIIDNDERGARHDI